MMHFFQISISPISFLVVRWQTFSNCLSDYVRIAYLFYTTCILLRMSIGYLEPLAFKRIQNNTDLSDSEHLHGGPAVN